MPSLQYRLFFAFFALAACSACGPGPAMTFSNVPNPVLLGPVDRVRGASRPTRFAGGFEVDVEQGAYMASSRYSTSSRAWNDSPRKASFEALEATNARADRDIRLDKVKAGSWFHCFLTTFWLSQWVEAHGETQEVSP
jgi:hypothetical protein